MKRKINGQIRKGFVQDINIWKCLNPKFAIPFAYKKRENKKKVYIGVNLQGERSYNSLGNIGKDFNKEDRGINI